MKQQWHNRGEANLLVVRWGVAANGQADGLDRVSQGLVAHLGQTRPGCHLMVASSEVLQSAPASNWDWCSLPADIEQACRTIGFLQRGLGSQALIGVGESCQPLLQLLAQEALGEPTSPARIALLHSSKNKNSFEPGITPISIDEQQLDFAALDNWLQACFPGQLPLAVIDPSDPIEIETNLAALEKRLQAGEADSGPNAALQVTLRWQAGLGPDLDRVIQRILRFQQVAGLRVELLSNQILPVGRRGLTHAWNALLLERGFWRFGFQLGRLLLGVPKAVELVFISDSPQRLIRTSVSLANQAGRWVRLLKARSFARLRSEIKKTSADERFLFDPQARQIEKTSRLDLLFFAIDGRGLGHLNRTLLLAQAACAKRSTLKVEFAVESQAAFMVAREGFPVTKMPDPLHPLTRFALAGERKALERRVLQDLVRSRRPRVIVFDFWLDQALFDWLHKVGVRVVVVVRRLRTEALEQLAGLPAAGLVDDWIIPHAENEFEPGDHPGRFLSPCHFVGSLVRALDQTRIESMRKRIASSLGSQGTRTAKLVVASLGGGGYAQSVELAGAIREALHEVQKRLGPESFFAVVICGPLFPRALFDDESRIRFQRYEPDLPALMALADVVISTAGYNSVNELVVSGTPGILLPLEEIGRDDQMARAEKADEEGWALVCERNKEKIASALVTLLQGSGPAKRPYHIRDMNRLAGQVLLELI